MCRLANFRITGAFGFVCYFAPMSEIPAEFEEQPIVWSDEAVRISERFQAETSLQGVS